MSMEKVSMHTDTDFSNVSRPAAPYVRHRRLPTPLTPLGGRWMLRRG